VQIDGRAVNNIGEYRTAIAASNEKKKLFVVVRQGEAKEIYVTFA